VWYILTKQRGRPDVKRQLGRPRHGWDIFEMDIQEFGW
jgi:hypothetical protein